MVRITRVLLFMTFFSLLSSHLSVASAAHWQKTLTKKLEQLENEQGIEASVFAKTTNGEEVVYSHKEDRTLIPASNMKIITTAAALNTLGSQFTFKTEIYHTGTIQNGALNGDLYVKGYGNPLFVSERLWYLINELTREGFTKITGDLVLDNSYFDEEDLIASRIETGTERAYNAPLSALSFNFNVIAVYVRPGKLGQKPKVIIDPDNNFIDIRNKAVTGKQDTLVVSRIHESGKNIIEVAGSYPEQVKERRFYRNITNPSLFYGAVFNKFLKDRGIHLNGKIKKGVTPSKAQLLYTHNSQVFREIVLALNQFSNNFIAEQIVKTMGAEKKGLPGTSEKGVSVIEDFLVNKIGFEKSSFNIVNGSGFSRDNRFSAKQFVEILNQTSKEFDLGPEFSVSLGVPSDNGTLGRFKNTPLYKRLRAKTGSINGVLALSGFVLSDNKKTIVFSILLNSKNQEDAHLQETLDEILLHLSKSST